MLLGRTKALERGWVGGRRETLTARERGPASPSSLLIVGRASRVGSAPVSVPCAEALATLSIQPESPPPNRPLLLPSPPDYLPSPSPPPPPLRRSRLRISLAPLPLYCSCSPSSVISKPVLCTKNTKKKHKTRKEHRKHGNEKQTNKKAKHNFRNLFINAASARPPIPLPVLCSSRLSPSTHTNFLSPGGSYAVEIHGSCPGPNSQLTS